MLIERAQSREELFEVVVDETVWVADCSRGCGYFRRWGRFEWGIVRSIAFYDWRVGQMLQPGCCLQSINIHHFIETEIRHLAYSFKTSLIISSLRDTKWQRLQYKSDNDSLSVDIIYSNQVFYFRVQVDYWEAKNSLLHFLKNHQLLVIRMKFRKHLEETPGWVERDFFLEFEILVKMLALTTFLSMKIWIFIKRFRWLFDMTQSLIQGKKSVKIIHVEKMDSDLGLVLSGGKGAGDGNIILADIVPGKSANKFVSLLLFLATFFFLQSSTPYHVKILFLNSIFLSQVSIILTSQVSIILTILLLQGR